MVNITDDFTATLPYSLWTAEQVKQAEPQLAEQGKISLDQLMERAGTGSYHLLRCHWPDARRLLIIAGGGNNGGDGLVVARLAAEQGFTVELLLHGDPVHFPNEASCAWQKLQGANVRMLDTLSQAGPCDVVIDALLGSGLKGAVRSDCIDLITQMNALNSPVLALDIPSGLSADTGQPLGIAVKATATITFIGIKQGLLTGQAAAYCGDILYSNLGLSKPLENWHKGRVQRGDYARFKKWLPFRSVIAHKGYFGRVVLLGGDYGTAGAIRLAGEACQRTGAGLIEVLTRPEHLSIVLSGRPELMAHGLTLTDQVQLSRSIQQASVLVVGPGLGQSDWSKWLWQYALESDKPLVLDADGLNLLAQEPKARGNWILTPHPGEAARLLACQVRDVEQDRFAAAIKIARRYDAVVVLKGAGTIVATPDEQCYVLAVGNPGMASGGMGDVLSGIIGGLLAQHVPAVDAACLAVCLHGEAADRAAVNGQRGMLAGDLLPEIRVLVNPEQME
ncbi:MAG: Bifunctional NAD(P)H-hydrate repair enzyme Nnr [Candidatus Celerinatantimonas neptuna]|nr:MAG: Bifunctional NAD(P)H-hydrate repair enzyme Nnr [Candidatus Celerinatantimonas neptuna]